MTTILESVESFLVCHTHTWISRIFSSSGIHNKLTMLVKFIHSVSSCPWFLAPCHRNFHLPFQINVRFTIDDCAKNGRHEMFTMMPCAASIFDGSDWLISSIPQKGSWWKNPWRNLYRDHLLTSGERYLRQSELITQTLWA